MLEIIHISDTHFGPNRELDIRGAAVCARSELLVEKINALPFQPDLIVHTGDVVNDPDEAAYALAESVLSKLKAPIYYATGNHDDVPMMRKALTIGAKSSLVDDSENRFCYRVEGLRDDFDFIFVDAKVPEEEGPHGFIPESQMEAVLDAISGEKPTAIFLHYPLTPIGSKWIDEHLLVTNGVEFQEKLHQKCGTNLRGIFSGHLHRGLQLYRNGVLQSGVSSPACEFSAGPDDDFCDFLTRGPVPFNHITLTDEATLVKSYAFPFQRPDAG